ncbi:Hydroxyacylglutathione hydrolase GloB [Buchnera aphidicola (Eriosoma lanigerum)]|uniref:hydroxyacylglutathione hydrolase n=1 Tax=Buchnera aphidicola TaxID=9 RepID=UPI0034645B06
MLYLTVIPILQDNYVWILRNSEKCCIIVDPGEFTPIFKVINKFKLIPKIILITHNHIDHVSGIQKLIQNFPKIKVYGPIDCIKYGVNNILIGGESINLLQNKCIVMHTPGHTLDHLSYYIKPYFFCGDTLFSGGCGKVNNNYYYMMFKSLKKISLLPESTLICCSHEYTKQNIKFAISVFPKEKELTEFYYLINKKKQLLISLPSTLKIEKKINIFLKLTLNQDIHLESYYFNLFIKLRKEKDNY